LVLTNGATHSGIIAGSTSFLLGSTYEHQFTTTEGIIPLATWDAGSTLSITGYTTFTTATAAGNWSQSFGIVSWNCPGQTGIVNLQGLLTDINGNFDILNTGAGTGVLRLATTQTVTVDIDGNLSLLGTSSLDLATTGVCTVDIDGDFSMNATGETVRMVAGSGGTGTISIGGNFDLDAGTITETGAEPAQGNIDFTGTDVLHTFSNTGTISNRINYNIPASNTVQLLDESQLRGNAGSTLVLTGTLIVASTNSTGAVLNGSGTGLGAIRVATRTYNSGSRLVYGGTSPQFMGTQHPNVTTLITEIDNNTGVTVVATNTPTIGGDLIISTGDLNVTNAGLIVTGNVQLVGGNLIMTTVSTGRTMTLNGNIDLDGGELQVNSGTANAVLALNGTVSGSNFISFTGTNSNLQIGGTGALGIDFPLPGATTIEALTVNRTSGLVVFPEDLTITTTLTLNNGEIDTNAELAVTGAVTMASGTIIDFQDNTLSLSGSLTSSGLFEANANSTFNIVGSGNLGTIAFSPSANTVGTLNLNRTAGTTNVTLNSALTVGTTMNVLDGVFANTSGLNFTSGVVLTRNSAGSLTGSAPTGGPYDLFLTGGTMTTAAETAGAINDVTSNSTGSVSLGSALNAAGVFSINSGTFISAANTISVGSFFNAGGITAPSTTFTLTGDFTNDGTFTRNGGTVIFNGTTSILGSTIPTFQNITINGTLIAPATLNLAGAFTNNGTFNAGTGTVAFLGTAAVTQVVSGSAVTIFNNMTVSNTTASPDVSINSNQNLAGVLTLAANVIFDADGPGSSVFTLLSTGDSPTQDASIANIPGSASVQGNITVQRYMSGEGRIYRYISSPVTGATVASWQDDFTITGTFSDPSTTPTSICGVAVIPTNPSMYRYDETLGSSGTTDLGWQAFPTAGTAASNPLEVGRGYSPFIRECTVPTVIDVTGTATQQSVNVNLRFTNNGNASLDGYNLVGNPYPSAINWQAAGWVRNANVGTVIGIRDNAAGTFTYYDYSDGSPNDIIAMGQAFWVRALVDNTALGFREATKSSTPTSFYRTSGDNVLTISLTRGAVVDKAFLKLNPDATTGLDRYDGPKLNNAQYDLSTLSAEGVPMAINATNEIVCGVEMPLNFKFVSNPNGNYSMEFSPNGAFKGYTLTLVDAHSGTSVDVTANPVYTYQIDNSASSRAATRFKLLFNQQPLGFAARTESNCVSESASVDLGQTQYGVNYFVTLNDVVVSDTLVGTGVAEVLTVESARLASGVNTVVIHATGQCITQDVPLSLVKVEPLQIIDSGIGHLQSSVENGNQWYFNNEPIPNATQQTLAIVESGMYKVEATVNGCATSGEQEVIVLEAEKNSKNGISVYPNPTRGEVNVVISGQTDAREVQLINSMGLNLDQSVLPQQFSREVKSSFSLSNYPSGVYFVKVIGSKYISIIKIVKK
jgi:hypothetical protein